MFKRQDLFKAKLSEVSAKTLSLGGKQFIRSRNEQKIKFQEGFVYPQLSDRKSIRLLKIHEGNDIDVVACDVFVVDLDQRPTFEALSYTWNLDPRWDTFKFQWTEVEEKEERPILCNGKTHHITMNLYHALTELRRQKWQLPIWADQICINQNDSNEKVAQLDIMVDVFRSATCVTIWLGKLSSLRSQALDFIEKLPDESNHSVQIPSISESTATMSQLTRSFSLVSSLSSSVGDQYHWIGVVLVIGRQWFSRAWTLQEFLLATNFRLLMGNREISPSSFIKAASQSIEFYSTDPLSVRYGLNVTFLSLRRFIQGRAELFAEREKFQNGKRYSAEEYLGVIRVRRATEMKDKVIAGAALLKERGPSSVDYRSTTLEIYIAYASERLWPEIGIFSLSLVGGTAPAVEGLPSWVPDLSNPLRPEPLRYCGCPTFKKLLPSEGIGFRIDDKTLQIKAAKWDVITDVGESIWSWTQFYDEPYNINKRLKMRTSGPATNERFGLMLPLINNLGVTYKHTGESTIDAFWQVLIGGINLNSEDEFSVWRDRFHQWFAFTLASIRSCLYEEKKEWTSKLIQTSTPKQWMVPLITDWVKMEERVSAFLDLHDPKVESIPASEISLRRTISQVAKRLWGADTIEQSGSLKGSLTEMLSTVRREKFYEPISVFGQHFETVYDGRRVFVSEKGYLGTGTEDVKAGDLLVLVVGADVPYVLRPVSHNANTFTLVGEAYLHGIMDGGDGLIGDSEFSSLSII